MKTLILIFHLLVCIFEIWMLSDFYDAFLGYKNKGKKRNIFIVLCFALIIFAINSFNNTVLNLSVVPFMYFLLAVVGFSGNIYKKIFGTFMAGVILGLYLDSILLTKPLLTLVFLVLAFIEVMRTLLKGGKS